MLQPIYPQKLHQGSHLRMVAPASSRAFAMRGNNNIVIAEERLKKLGFTLSYGEHVDEMDDYGSSSVESRLADLHTAFADPHVDGVLSILGGFNSNELLPHIDFDLIAKNPKVFCGYSDITALQNAIFAQTGLVTYSGPHWSTFGMRDYSEQTTEWFIQALMQDSPIEVHPAQWFTDDLWFLDQDNRPLYPTDGWWKIRSGTAEGTLLGGNLSTVNLLQGTQNMPSLKDSVLFVEDEETVDIVTFRRDLHSLLQLPGAESVQGLVIGRFQNKSEVARVDIENLVATLPIGDSVPVLANVDFGHTNPMLTFPVGGQVSVVVGNEEPTLLFQ